MPLLPYRKRTRRWNNSCFHRTPKPLCKKKGGDMISQTSLTTNTNQQRNGCQTEQNIYVGNKQKIQRDDLYVIPEQLINDTLVPVFIS